MMNQQPLLGRQHRWPCCKWCAGPKTRRDVRRLKRREKQAARKELRA